MMVRRSRLSAGAVRMGTFAAFARAGGADFAGADFGAAERAGAFRAAVALAFVVTGRGARAFLAVALGAFRAGFVTARRPVDRAVFFAARFRPAALRVEDRPRAAPRAAAPVRRVVRAALRFAIAGSFRRSVESTASSQRLGGQERPARPHTLPSYLDSVR